MKICINMLILAIISFVVPEAAYSQSVTLYGIVDTGLEYLSHASTAGASISRQTGVTGSLPSRWGIKGTEELGSGVKAIFTLESGFFPSTGTLAQGSRLFGRQAFLGLESELGSVTFGRQYSMLFWAIYDVDFIGPAVYGTASFDAWIANARSDYAVVYRRQFGPFTLGGTYSFGRDASPTGSSNLPGTGSCAGNVPGDNRSCREWSAMVKYESAFVAGAVAYDRQYGGSGASASFFNGTTPLPMTSSANRDSRFLVDAKVTLESFKISSFWLNRQTQTGVLESIYVRSNQFGIEGNYFINPFLVIDGLAQRIINSSQNTRATMEVVRITYLLSKRSAVYVQIGLLQNSAKAAYGVSAGGPSTPRKGMNQTGVMVGLRNFF